MCYNIYNGFSGSFAAIYHASTFNEMLRWIASARAAPRTPRFHDAYTHLADAGYIVRAAFPNLALRETSDDPLKHTDKLESAQIAVRLRWFEGKYCRRGGQPAFSV